jgi:hypothetical protein
MDLHFGFKIDPAKTAWANASEVHLNRPPTALDRQVSNLKFHNLCTHLVPPIGIESVLGYDLKHCVQHKTPQNDAEASLSRLERDVRIRFLHRDNQQEDDTDDENEMYDPKIYVKLKGWNPDPCPIIDVEKELATFRKQFLSLVAKNKPKPTSNLSKRQEKLLTMLQSAKQFIVIPTDKNLGPAIMERSQYISRCFQDHLTVESIYSRLTAKDATVSRYNSRGAIIRAVTKSSKIITHAERTYFRRSFSAEPIRRPPQFYILPKVHKTPWKTRPVVSCVGSFNEIASKWLDYKLSKLVDLCPSYTKDSYQILEDLAKLGELPPNARLFTSDAVSMYTNIDTEHGIETIGKWLDLHKEEIEARSLFTFPFDLVKELLRIVMTSNVFQFDDCWYHQDNGTAMGTSVACVYATIYYSYHEETKLLPTYQSSLLYYRRFIDDIIGIWIPPDPTDSQWTAFNADLSFGLLRWETEALAHAVNFLDLTISVNHDYKLTTRTFQKAMNLYLYLCPSSSHPPSVMKGLIYGSVRRFWLQNSNPTDYRRVLQEFFSHLRARGHTKEKLMPLFLEAAGHVDSKQKEKPHRAPRPSRLPNHGPCSSISSITLWNYKAPSSVKPSTVVVPSYETS